MGTEHIYDATPATLMEDECGYPLNIAEQTAAFDEINDELRFRVTNLHGTHYLVPKLYADLLGLMDGTRTARQLANILGDNHNVSIAPHEIVTVVQSHFVPRKLVRVCNGPTSDCTANFPRDLPRRQIDFVFRFTVTPEKYVSLLTRHLTWAFKYWAIAVAMTAVITTHVLFYLCGFPRHVQPNQTSDVALAFLLTFISVYIHEFGHATAARVFGCRHDEIGFCLYLIFPALYIDLTRAWRLSRRERAVVDVAGLYFQLVATIPCYVLYLLTGHPYYATTFQLIDISSVVALNPLMKFDGYWLLSDLMGISNLQARAFAFIKGAASWSIGGGARPTFTSRSTVWSKAIFTTYAGLLAAGVISSIVFMCSYAPARARAVFYSLDQLQNAFRVSLSTTIMDIVSLTEALLFFVFLWNLLRLAIREIKGTSIGQRILAAQQGSVFRHAK
jgi:putative peptide zinc metalloprotease protein